MLFQWKNMVFSYDNHIFFPMKMLFVVHLGVVSRAQYRAVSGAFAHSPLP